MPTEPHVPVSSEPLTVTSTALARDRPHFFPVAEIYYATLQTAVSAARDGDVVTVLKDIDEDVTLPLRLLMWTA